VWLDNDVEVGRGKSVQVKLGPGEHRITLKVSDGTAEATTEITIKVTKARKEQVTVQGDWWIPLAIVVIAAAGVGGALVAMKRFKRKEPSPETSPPSSAPPAPPSAPQAKPPSVKASSAEAAVALSAGAAAAAAPSQDKDRRDKARKALDAAEDAVADALESGADTAAAEESLDTARDFFKDGDYDEAISYANEAKASLKPEEASRPGVGKLACPECGEELQPDWPACPVCGHKTR
jgi:hypothetical protein